MTLDVSKIHVSLYCGLGTKEPETRRKNSKSITKKTASKNRAGAAYTSSFSIARLKSISYHPLNVFQ